MKLVSIFTTLCLFTATAFAIPNNPRKETEISGRNAQLSHEVRANPKKVSLIQNSTIRANLTHVNANSGHIYVTNIAKAGSQPNHHSNEGGQPNVTPVSEYVVHAVWVKN